MELLCSLFLLALQVSTHAARSHPQALQGLSCVNDFVSNVSCTWDGSPPQLAPGVDCWIIGVKKAWVWKNWTRNPVPIARSCKLRHRRGSSPGCSFVFEKKTFNKLEVMPNISMECNGTLVDVINNYKPVSHIKMHPPGRPSVNKTANFTCISWSPGSPLSEYIQLMDFELQVTQENQTWKEANTLFTQEQEIRLPSWQVKGSCQVRVRVRYAYQPKGHWSNWSPTASWMGATDAALPQLQDWFSVKRAVFLSVSLVVLTLVVYGSCVINRRRKGNPVPSPSKYFHTLHSVHKGNLKKWLNPLSASDSFFTAEAPDQISPVEVCESWHVVPSTSPSSSSTSALLHFQSYPFVDSDTSGIVDNLSSSSSSCFYNMGYFMSASSGSSARTDPSAAYFTYQDDFHTLHNGHNLHVQLCPPFTAPPTYELLKREPQSPDSGFGIGREDEEDKIDGRRMDVRGKEVSDDPQRSPLFNSPLQLCPPSAAPPLPHPPVLTQKSPDSHQVAAPVAAAGGSYAAWPAAGMCRSSSMPVESCKTGYLTLKELQTTFSNKSI